ncbi:MAG: hypothetical protein ABI831_14405 [Betaproteobacteria bacterium]
MSKHRAGLIQVLCGLAGLVLGIMPPAANSAQVIEFYNSLLDNYFITADAVEAGAVDNGGAGPGWSRTGDTFNGGGVNPVCRFYGSLSPGPNSHFYTVNPAECALLKQLQATTPASQQRWNFESLDFLTAAPINGGCLAGTVPVYRAYNNGAARGVDSNHRITTSPANIDQVVARGWVSEGIVLCGASPASVTATAQFFQQAKGVWTFGDASTPTVVRIEANGGYLQATTSNAGSNTRPGLERGRIGYDALGRHFNGVAAQDTDGDAGFSGRGSDSIPRETIAVEGGFIVVRDAGGAELLRVTRVDNDQGSVVGAWALGTTENLAAQHFAFLANGRFVMIDPVGDTSPNPCGGPGVELGTYTWNGGTGTLTITGVTIDTNGCAGLNEPPSPSVLFAPGDHSLSGISLTDGGNTLSQGDVVLRRVTP